MTSARYISPYTDNPSRDQMREAISVLKQRGIDSKSKENAAETLAKVVARMQDGLRSQKDLDLVFEGQMLLKAKSRKLVLRDPSFTDFPFEENPWKFVPDKFKSPSSLRPLDTSGKLSLKVIGSVFKDFVHPDVYHGPLGLVKKDKAGYVATDAHVLAFIPLKDKGEKGKYFAVNNAGKKRLESEPDYNANYPDYWNVIPSIGRKPTIHKVNVRRLYPLCDAMVRLGLGNQLILLVKGRDGSLEKYGVNPANLAKVCKFWVLNGKERVSFLFTGANRSILSFDKQLTKDLSDPFTLLMPMKIDFQGVSTPRDYRVAFRVHDEAIITEDQGVRGMTLEGNKLPGDSDPVSVKKVQRRAMMRIAKRIVRGNPTIFGANKRFGDPERTLERAIIKEGFARKGATVYMWDMRDLISRYGLDHMYGLLNNKGFDLIFNKLNPSPLKDDKLSNGSTVRVVFPTPSNRMEGGAIPAGKIGKVIKVDERDLYVSFGTDSKGEIVEVFGAGRGFGHRLEAYPASPVKTHDNRSIAYYESSRNLEKKETTSRRYPKNTPPKPLRKDWKGRTELPPNAIFGTPNYFPVQVGSILSHISQPIEIELLSPTNKGYKVSQTTYFPGTRRKPRTKTAYFTKQEIKANFLHIQPAKETDKPAVPTESSKGPSSKKAYTYFLTQRPPGIGTFPIENRIIDDPEEGIYNNRRYWKLKYSKPLSQEEVKNYELQYDLKHMEGEPVTIVLGEREIGAILSKVSDHSRYMTVSADHPTRKGKKIDKNYSSRKFVDEVREGRIIADVSPYPVSVSPKRKSQASVPQAPSKIGTKVMASEMKKKGVVKALEDRENSSKKKKTGKQYSPAQRKRMREEIAALVTQVSKGKDELTPAQVIRVAKKINAKRSLYSQYVDAKGDSAIRRLPTLHNLKVWAKNPGNSDLIGVDTNQKTDATINLKRKPKPRKKKAPQNRVKKAAKGEDLYTQLREARSAKKIESIMKDYSYGGAKWTGYMSPGLHFFRRRHGRKYQKFTFTTQMILDGDHTFMLDNDLSMTPDEVAKFARKAKTRRK